jgi:hypothetical protein
MTIYGYVVAAALFTAVGWFAAAGGNTAAVGKEPRFPQLTMQDLNDRQHTRWRARRCMSNSMPR